MKHFWGNSIKVIKSKFKLIEEGFLNSIGMLIATGIGSMVGIYFGGKGVVDIVEKNTNIAIERTDSIINAVHNTFQINSHNPDPDLASHFELLGYQALLQEDIDSAIIYFTSSENAYNSFHQSYELSLYLRKLRGEKQTVDFWQNIYLDMTKKYNDYIPDDILSEFISRIN